MPAPFPKFTAGGIGDARTGKVLSFDHVNRIIDATLKVEGESAHPGQRPDRVIRTFFAELVADSGSNIGTDNLWTWEQVGVDSGASAVGNQTGLLTSSMFPSGQGLAIALNASTPSSGDVVLMHEIDGFDGVRRFAFTVGGTGATTDRLQLTWAVINATQSGGTITTGVAPTDLGDGIFEYKAVPVKFTGYSAGAFTYSVDDDLRFEPTVYGGTNITLLNPPTHENDADWKYAGVVTSTGSGYPSSYDIRGIGEKRDLGGGSSTWKSVLVQVGRYDAGEGGYLWIMMAEPDHDGACEAGGVVSEATAMAIGALRA